MATTPELPTHIKAQIAWLVGRYHVGKSDTEVKSDIIRRLKGDVDERTRRQVAAYAVRQHRRNLKLYLKVMSGNL